MACKNILKVRLVLLVRAILEVCRTNEEIDRFRELVNYVDASNIKIIRKILALYYFFFKKMHLYLLLLLFLL